MDVFELNTYGWEDDVDDLPLTYTFAYVSGSADAADTSTEMIVRAALESSEATDVYLPQVSNATARWRLRDENRTLYQGLCDPLYNNARVSLAHADYVE